MSGFFELPPEPAVPEPQRYRMPPWLGAPSGTLPGVVALERILAQTARVAVCVSRLAAYPTGFECDVLTMTADDDEDLDPMNLDPMLFHHHHHLRRGAADDIAPQVLRLGVQFADGSKATNVGGFPDDRDPPGAPGMLPGGGGGGGGSWRQTNWVWPLPPAGPVVLVCEWPAMDIPLTRTPLDAQTILDAASRAQIIFSDEHLPEPPDEVRRPEPERLHPLSPAPAGPSSRRRPSHRRLPLTHGAARRGQHCLTSADKGVLPPAGRRPLARLRQPLP